MTTTTTRHDHHCIEASRRHSNGIQLWEDNAGQLSIVVPGQPLAWVGAEHVDDGCFEDDAKALAEDYADFARNCTLGPVAAEEIVEAPETYLVAEYIDGKVIVCTNDGGARREPGGAAEAYLGLTD